ncbi:protein kinase [Spirillospora sp. NPDC049652]
MSGRLIADRYRLERLRGRSMFADLWSARDEARADAAVTVRVLRPPYAGTAWAARMFEEETRVLRRCRSRFVVTVLDEGVTAAGRPFRVTEHVVPFSRSLQETGPGWAPAALRRAEAAARAVAAVHRAGYGVLSLTAEQFARRPGESDLLLCDLGLAIALSPGPYRQSTQVTHADGDWFRGSPELRRRDLYVTRALAREWLIGLGAHDFAAPWIADRVSAALTMEIDEERRPVERFAEALALARGSPGARLRAAPRATGRFLGAALVWLAVFLTVPLLAPVWTLSQWLVIALMLPLLGLGWALGQLGRGARFLWRTMRRRHLPPSSPGARPENWAASFGTPGDPPAIPLQEGFRYVHEPLWERHPGLPDLGPSALTEALRERIAYSHGGTFLITGFRGVGKTTMIQRALKALEERPPEGRRVLPVVLSVARPMTTGHLLFAMVRRVFEALNESGEFDRLPEATRHLLLLTYMRTSLSFKETRSDATERGASAEVGLSASGMKALGASGLALPKLGMSSKRTRSLATEAAFLAYSETDVEYDMMRIVRILSEPRPVRRRGLVPRSPRRNAGGDLPLSLVVVLDEVDKLTSSKKGMAALERLLSGMKNVISMPGAYYVVVAGPDLQDRVLLDVGRGNGVYESIFAWRLYVPCSWRAAHALVTGLVQDGDAPSLREPLRLLSLYLTFRSRGVLRKLLQEAHSFVQWRDDRPFLRFTPEDWDRVRFYAGLEETLDAFFTATAGHVFPSEIDQDRWRLGGHYVTDWILRSEGLPFTAADIQKAVDDGDFDAQLRIRPAAVDLLLEHLADAGVLTVVRRVSASATFLADVAESRLTSYRLADDVRRSLRGIAKSNPDERAELNVTLSPQMRSGATVVPTPPDPSLTGMIARPPAPPVGAGHGLRTIDDRYELRRLIGEGGMSTVYEGYDTMLQRTVAIKQLRSVVADDAQARERFRREAEISRGLRHPHVVAVYDLVSDGPSVSIVMEYLDGPSLAESLALRRLPPHEVVSLGASLAGTLQYLADQGLARLDVKPGNVILVPDRGPVIIDLGIAKAVNDLRLLGRLTETGVIIGTPLYMAPEQIEGAREIDIRADVFALGMVLLACLLGEHPYAQDPPLTVLANIVERTMDVSALPVSPELRGVLARALHRDPAKRFQHPADLRQALLDVPESDASQQPPARWTGPDREPTVILPRPDLGHPDPGQPRPGPPVDAPDQPTAVLRPPPLAAETRLERARPAVPDEVLTTAQLASRLSLTPRKVRQLAKDGAIPSSREGTAYRFSWAAVREALRTGQRTS